MIASKRGVRMTIVFSCVSHKLIAMTVDSTVILDFDDGHREYSTGRKAYLLDGVGCIATWGVRDGNRLGDYLQKQNISAATHSVTDLADLVYSYLTTEYRPKDRGFDDVGYHISGFDQSGNARIYHVFWGFDRPRPPDQLERRYNKNDHSPNRNNIQFVYNGRNDLAETVVITLLGQISAGNVLRFDTSSIRI
jgi:hypothetical protein